MKANKKKTKKKTTLPKQLWGRADKTETILKYDRANQSSPQSRSVPQLPLVVLTKVVSMLPRNHEGYAFKDRLQLAAVGHPLRQAVLTCIQQQKQRNMLIRFNDDAILINDVVVKHERQSSYSQIDLIDAFRAFAQPTALILISEHGRMLLNQVCPQILTSFPPLSLARLDIQLSIKEHGVNLPLEKALKAIGSMVNLEALKITVAVIPGGQRYRQHYNAMSSASLSTDISLDHLLTLRNLHTICIYAPGRVSQTEIESLLNRSPSNISHFCCFNWNWLFSGNSSIMAALSDGARVRIASLCCVQYEYADAVPRLILVRLPNCRTINYRWLRSVSHKVFDQLGHQLLDICDANDSHRGRILDCSIGCVRDGDLQMYLEEGGETQMEYTRGHTVIRLSIGSEMAMEQKHCPFSYNNPDHYL